MTSDAVSVCLSVRASRQGAVKQKVDFTDREGEAIYIDINGSAMVVGSVNGALKLFDLSRRSEH